MTLILGSMHAFLQGVYKLEKKPLPHWFYIFRNLQLGNRNHRYFFIWPNEIYNNQKDITQTIVFLPLDIEAVGSAVPYYLFEPVLKRCTAAQLYRIEDFNPVCMCSTCTLYIY